MLENAFWREFGSIERDSAKAAGPAIFLSRRRAYYQSSSKSIPCRDEPRKASNRQAIQINNHALGGGRKGDEYRLILLYRRYRRKPSSYAARQELGTQ